MGSTGRGAASATKPQAQFNPGDAVKKAAPKPQQQAQVAARDGHVMGMHPKPVPHKERAAAAAAPGSVQQLSLLTRGLEVARADVPVTFATDTPEEVRYRPPPKPQAQPQAQAQAKPPAAPAAEPAAQGVSILSLLKQQLKISSDEPPPAPASAPSSTASASMGGFRIHRGPPAAGAPAPAAPPAPPAPPAVPLEPVVLSDGSGRAALAQAAGLVGSALPPMPAGPVEAPLAGVIQVPTVPGGLMGMLKANTGAAPQARGFFSGAEGKGQRPPSPSKARAASPAKRAASPAKKAPAAAKAEAAPADASTGEESGSKPAAVSVKERLANAKAMMLKRRQDKGLEAPEPSAAPAETRVPDAEAEAAAAAAAVSLADLEGSASAPAVQGASAAAAGGADKASEKKLVPLNLLLKKAAQGK